MTHAEAHKAMLEELGLMPANGAFFDFATTQYLEHMPNHQAADHPTRYGFRKGSVCVGGLFEPYASAWDARDIPEGLGFRVLQDVKPSHDKECIVVALWVKAYRLPASKRRPFQKAVA